MPTPNPAVPEVRRVSYDEQAHRAAAGRIKDDPDRAGAIAAQATRLEPLQRIQTALDQLAFHAAGHRRGEAWDHAGSSFSGYAKDVLGHARGLGDVLHAAAEAADAMISHMEGQIKTLETVMAGNILDDDTPSLTPDGSLHPLQAGDYDANADPQLPGHESDVATGKAGQTTRAQAEAIAAGDKARNDERDRARAEYDARQKAQAEARRTKGTTAPAPPSPAPTTAPPAPTTAPPAPPPPTPPPTAPAPVAAPPKPAPGK